MEKALDTIIKPIPEVGEMWRSSGVSLHYMNDSSYEVDICSPDPWVSFQFKTYPNAIVANPHKTIHQGTIFKDETHFWGRHTPVFAKNPHPYEQVLVIFNENLLTREEGSPISLDITHNRYAMTDKDVFVKQIMTSYHQEIQTGFPMGSLYLDALSRVLATHIVQNYCNGETAHSTHIKHAEDALLNKTIKYMHDYFHQDIRIDDLANLVHLTPYYYIRLFKKTYGAPPYQYLLNLRMKKAQKLLAQGSLSITEIAGLCGFNSQSGFNTNFKKTFGVPPQAYRRQLSLPQLGLNE